MRSFAALILRSRLQAALIIVLAALAPLVNFISGAALALVTLRQGAGEGLVVVSIATCLAAPLLWLLTGSATPAVGVAALFWLPVWGLATTLRYTISLAKTLQLALLVSGLLLASVWLYLDDPLAWSQSLLQKAVEPLLNSLRLAQAEQADILARLQALLAPLLPGLLLANGLLSVVLSLLVGRWWQALLFNPGGFQAEFHELRLGQSLALLVLAVFALALITRSILLSNVALIIAVIYALQGIALVHGLVGHARLSVGWLVGFYTLLALALPQLMFVLCLLGVVDAWLNFRSRIKASAGIS